MRLIDADAFECHMQNEWECNEISNGDWIHFREMLNSEITIVPLTTTWLGNYTPYTCKHCGKHADSKTPYCCYCGRKADNYEHD